MDARYRLQFLSLSETLTGVRISSLPGEVPPANEQPRALPGDLDPRNSPVDLAAIYYEAIAVNGYEGELVALLNAFPVTGTADEKRGFIRGLFKDKKDRSTARLCNAIIKLWYLGIWYPLPLGDDSECVPGDDKAGWKRWPSLPHEVVSMEAYRSGLVWKIMRAHPMAYSTSPFGYWAEDPPPLNRFLTKA